MRPPTKRRRNRMTDDPSPDPTPTAALPAVERARGRRALGARRLRAATSGRRGFWAAVAVALVAGGTLAAVLGARAVASSEASKARLAFHLSSSEIASTLTLAIQHEEDLVVSASAFVTRQPECLRRRRSTGGRKRCAQCSAIRSCSNIGLVQLVPASPLAALRERASRARPGAGRSGPTQRGVGPACRSCPPGRRPYYCFAVAGMARDAASYIPAGTGLLHDRADADHGAATRAWHATRR